MRRLLTLLTLSLLSAGAAFAQTTPITQTSIRLVLNRVHNYILTAAPLRPVDATTGAAVSLSNMPKNVALGPTTLRVDSYEWGVTYAGMFQATDFITGDLRFRSYARNNINGLARMAAHMRANYPDATADNFPPRVAIRRSRLAMLGVDQGESRAQHDQPAPVDRHLRELDIDAAVPPG